MKMLGVDDANACIKTENVSAAKGICLESQKGNISDFFSQAFNVSERRQFNAKRLMNKEQEEGSLCVILYAVLTFAHGTDGNHANFVRSRQLPGRNSNWTFSEYCPHSFLFVCAFCNQFKYFL